MTMQAYQVSNFGDSSVLQLKSLPMPKPQAGQALIKLKAAGLNFIDIYMRRGMPRVAPELPYIPGREGAGIVEAVGEGVTLVKPGDRVCFIGSVGTYAEYAVVDATSLIALPDEISFVEGAAFPLQGMTAHYLLHDFYRITPQSTVLVHAAAGGVGLLLIQWLKKLGARSFGTVSTEEKARIAKEAGADEVILYTKQDFVEECKRLTNGKGVNYIIDGVGKTTFTKDLDAVCNRGWICVYGSASGLADPFTPNLLQARSITVSGGSLFSLISSREELLMRANAVIEGIRAKWLNLRVEHVFSFAEAARAQEALEGRETTGKVVLEIA